MMAMGVGCTLFQPITLQAAENAAKDKNQDKPKNVIFILRDDHRYNYMGFLETVPWLKTPNMDFMARNGAYIENTYVTTSLSSPSRASILTGLFSHEHKVVDNQAPCPKNLVYFPSYLQEAGYQTAFFGKWHMGDTGWNQQPGFDHWEAFKNQGAYYNNKMNINGEIVQTDPKRYIADLLTDHALDFIEKNKENPFFVYLSHKSVHDPFTANEDELGQYMGKKVPLPESFNTPIYGIHELPSKNAKSRPARGNEWYGEGRMPDWVKNQRESWHGVDYCYHGRTTF